MHRIGPDTELLYSYLYWLKCSNTKRPYHTACDKCHIQTKKHDNRATGSRMELLEIKDVYEADVCNE